MMKDLFIRNLGFCIANDILIRLFYLGQINDGHCFLFLIKYIFHKFIFFISFFFNAQEIFEFRGSFLGSLLYKFHLFIGHLVILHDFTSMPYILIDIKYILNFRKHAFS